MEFRRQDALHYHNVAGETILTLSQWSYGVTVGVAESQDFYIEKNMLFLFQSLQTKNLSFHVSPIKLFSHKSLRTTVDIATGKAFSKGK